MVVQVENLSLRLQVTGMEFIEIEGQKQEPVIGRACGQLVKASTLLFKKKKDAALRIHPRVARISVGYEPETWVTL